MVLKFFRHSVNIHSSFYIFILKGLVTYLQNLAKTRRHRSPLRERKRQGRANYKLAERKSFFENFCISLHSQRSNHFSCIPMVKEVKAVANFWSFEIKNKVMNFALKMQHYLVIKTKISLYIRF